MKKINLLLLLIVAVFLSACNRQIVLRKEVVKTAPFNAEKIEPGDYKLVLYRINYPDTLEEKQVFYSNMNLFFKKFYLAEKKLVMLVDKEYYEDFNRLETYSLLSEELLFDKAASNLTEFEIEQLRAIVDLEIAKYKDTVQEYLNLQVAYLMDFLGYKDEFDPEYVYTEREKNVYIDMLKEIRRENFKLLDSLDVDLVLEVESPYTEEGGIEEDRYWNERDIILATTSKFNSELNSYDIPLYIKGMKEEDLQGMIKGQDFIDNDVIIIESELYSGYLHNKNYLFFIGGDEEVREYSEYGIKIEVEELGLEELLRVEEEFVISDFTGGKK